MAASEVLFPLVLVRPRELWFTQPTLKTCFGEQLPNA